MNKVYSLTTEKSWKSALIDADRLLLINSSQADADKFLSAYNTTGVKSWLSSKKEISLASISGMAHKEAAPTDLTLKHGTKKEKLSFAATEDLEELVGIIAKASNLKPEVKTISKLKAAGGWIMGLIFTVLGGWVMHGFATDEFSYSDSGRRRWVSKLLYNAAQKMGPELVLAAAAALGAFIVYKIYSTVKNPPNEVVYE
jgi:hypothetical protein